jgi:hypothetical protein
MQAQSSVNVMWQKKNYRTENSGFPGVRESDGTYEEHGIPVNKDPQEGAQRD